jgi:polar amino acid transport system substrate-binding protein
MLSALYAGRVDFVVDDAVAASEVQKRSPVPVKIFADALLPKLYTGIVVLRGQSQLADALLAALKSLRSDGTYDAILDKWGVRTLALDEPGINLATARPLAVPSP